MHANKQDFDILEKLISEFTAASNDTPKLVMPLVEKTFWGDMSGYNSRSFGVVKVMYAKVPKVTVVADTEPNDYWRPM